MPLPPSLSGIPSLGSSPVSVPTGSPGLQAAAMAKVREAINFLNAAVSELPVGTDVHQAVMSAIQSLSKKVPPTASAQGVQQTELRNAMTGAGKNAMLQQVMSSLGAGGASQGAGSPSPAPTPSPGVM